MKSGEVALNPSNLNVLISNFQNMISGPFPQVGSPIITPRFLDNIERG